MSSSARMTWRLPADALGFYRVSANVVAVGPSGPSSLPDPETAPQAELSLAVIEPQALPRASEFGWSLGPHDADVGLVPLADLLGQCGVGRVKFPFAIQEATVPLAEAGSREKNVNPAKKDVKNTSADSLEALISFSDRLAMAGVGLVGVLQPPRAAGDDASRSDALLAAEAFARDPKTWYPSIEPILARLATQIRFWQIGKDRDPGWVGCRNLTGIVSRTKAAMDTIGQDFAMGIPWNLSAPLPIVATPSSPAVRSSSAKASSLMAAGSGQPKAPWRFLSLPYDEASGNGAMAQRLDSTKSAGVARWIVLEAPPREGQPHASESAISWRAC